MPSTTSKKTKKSRKSSKNSKNVSKNSGKLGFFANLKLRHAKNKDKRALRRDTKVKLHKSFKRSYREDYERSTELPGLLSHANATFKIIFRNWKLFLPFIFLVIIANIILGMLMSEESYNTFKEALEETNENIAQGQLGNVGKAGLLLIGTVTTGGLNRGMSEGQQVFMILILIII